HHRVLAAVEHIDIVLGIDPDSPDFFERPTVGQFRPILDDPVFEIASANNDRHARLSPDLQGQPIEAVAPKQSSSAPRGSPGRWSAYIIVDMPPPSCRTLGGLIR